MEDKNIYRKNDKGRYYPVGVYAGSDVLYDGIWHVKHYEHGKGMTNVNHLAGVYKIGDPKNLKLPDIIKICSIDKLAGDIMHSNEWYNMLDKGMSLSDAVTLTIKHIFKENT